MYLKTLQCNPGLDTFNLKLFSPIAEKVEEIMQTNGRVPVLIKLRMEKRDDEFSAVLDHLQLFQNVA